LFWRNGQLAVRTERGGFIPWARRALHRLRRWKFVGSEVKTAKEKLSDEQEAFAHLPRAVGGPDLVVRAIDNVHALGLSPKL